MTADIPGYGTLNQGTLSSTAKRLSVLALWPGSKAPAAVKMAEKLHVMKIDIII